MIVMLNINSGGGTALMKWNRISGKLNLNESTHICNTGSNGSFDQFIIDSVKNGKTDFVIAGGDGSINYFLNRCIAVLEPEALGKIRLGAVGIGSSNDFHKPYNARNIIGSIPVKLNFMDAVNRDIGCIQYDNNGEILKRYFVINASLGITAEGNHFFNNPDFILKYLKKLNTQMAITYAAIKNILTYKNFSAKLETNNESFTADISNLGIIKSPFFTGKLARFQSNPLPDNGLFDVHLYKSLSNVKLLKLFFCLTKGKSDNSFNKIFRQTDRIKISSVNEFAVEFDGEVIRTNYVEFFVIPGLIKVCIN